MISLVEEKKRMFENACGRYRVRRLELFGSAASGTFGADSSDLELPEGRYADACFALLEELRTLFRRDVDLVVSPAVKNPYLREGIERSSVLLYAD